MPVFKFSLGANLREGEYLQDIIQLIRFGHLCFFVSLFLLVRLRDKIAITAVAIKPSEYTRNGS